MLRFLRKIKQKLIAEKRFSNYLLYAVGEIILVVIGILIALAINNSNQNRLLRQKEQTYLAGLKNEFEISRFKLQELIAVNRQSFEGAKMIVEFISDESMVPGEKQFSELLFNSFASDVAFNPNNSLLNEMINSGSLKDISNPELRIQLTNWVSTLEDIAKQEIEQNNQREKVVETFRTQENSLRTILDLAGVSENELGLPQRKEHISNLKLLRSVEFENSLLLFMLSSQATEKSHYLPLLQDLEGILELINKEIR
ncbi:MAG: DUF6090 family protein [bacterium]|jgi:hypothetical protein